jgi:hypothetical protein
MCAHAAALPILIVLVCACVFSCCRPKLGLELEAMGEQRLPRALCSPPSRRLPDSSIRLTSCHQLPCHASATTATPCVP